MKSSKISEMPGELKDQLLALDGKRLRFANFLGNITHVVELFATEDRLVLAVEKAPNKTVEKTTLPDILSQVDVTGSIIQEMLILQFRNQQNKLRNRVLGSPNC